MAANGWQWPARVRILPVGHLSKLIFHFPTSLQVRILLRAMNLLKDNGRIVYSTCSLNPVENEAVLAEALAANPGPCS